MNFARRLFSRAGWPVRRSPTTAVDGMDRTGVPGHGKGPRGIFGRLAGFVGETRAPDAGWTEFEMEPRYIAGHDAKTAGVLVRAWGRRTIQAIVLAVRKSILTRH